MSKQVEVLDKSNATSTSQQHDPWHQERQDLFDGKTQSTAPRSECNVSSDGYLTIPSFEEYQKLLSKPAQDTNSEPKAPRAEFGAVSDRKINGVERSSDGQIPAPGSASRGEYASAGISTRGQHPLTGISTDGQHPVTGISTDGQHPVTGISTDGQHPVTSISTDGQHPVTGISTDGQHPVTSISTDGQHPVTGISTDGQHPVDYEKSNEASYEQRRSGTEITASITDPPPDPRVGPAFRNNEARRNEWPYSAPAVQSNEAPKNNWAHEGPAVISDEAVPKPWIVFTDLNIKTTKSSSGAADLR